MQPQYTVVGASRVHARETELHYQQDGSCHWLQTKQLWPVLSLCSDHHTGCSTCTRPPCGPPCSFCAPAIVLCALSVQGADAPAANGHAAPAALQRSAADLANGGRQSSVSPHGDAVLSPTSMLQQVRTHRQTSSNCCSFWAGNCMHSFRACRH